MADQKSAPSLTLTVILIGASRSHDEAYDRIAVLHFSRLVALGKPGDPEPPKAANQGRHLGAVK